MDTRRGDQMTGIDISSHKKWLVHILFALTLSVTLFLSGCGNSEQDEHVAAPKTRPVAAQNTTPVTSSGPCKSSGAGKIAPVSVTAATTIGDEGPNRVCDGDLTTLWNSGTLSPSWIQLDLGQPTTISKVRLNVSQTPAGSSTHQISAGPTPDKLTLVETLEGNTTDEQWIEVNKPMNNVRYLKIETVNSPSWVAWREIEINK